MKRLTNSGRDPIAILEGSNLLCMLVPMSTLDSKGTNARNIARIFERYNPFFLSISLPPLIPSLIFSYFYSHFNQHSSTVSYRTDHVRLLSDS